MLLLTSAGRLSYPNVVFDQIKEHLQSLNREAAFAADKHPESAPTRFFSVSMAETAPLNYELDGLTLEAKREKEQHIRDEWVRQLQRLCKGSGLGEDDDIGDIVKGMCDNVHFQSIVATRTVSEELQDAANDEEAAAAAAAATAATVPPPLAAGASSAAPAAAAVDPGGVGEAAQPADLSGLRAHDTLLRDSVQRSQDAQLRKCVHSQLKAMSKMNDLLAALGRTRGAVLRSGDEDVRAVRELCDGLKAKCDGSATEPYGDEDDRTPIPTLQKKITEIIKKSFYNPLNAGLLKVKNDLRSPVPQDFRETYKAVFSRVSLPFTCHTQCMSVTQCLQLAKRALHSTPFICICSGCRRRMRTVICDRQLCRFSTARSWTQSWCVASDFSNNTFV